jgi:hypothetical protein
MHGEVSTILTGVTDRVARTRHVDGTPALLFYPFFFRKQTSNLRTIYSTPSWQLPARISKTIVQFEFEHRHFPLINQRYTAVARRFKEILFY